jgi:uncharacterized protein (DUF169 family)
MPDYRELERKLSEAVGLERRPVAVRFLDQPPQAVGRFEGNVPSGCTFWRLASEGRSFYTVPSDHYNCPIGSHTHNIRLPKDRAEELQQTLSLMADIGYIRMEEVAQIPQLRRTPEAVLYTPLADTSEEPDVVVFAGRPKSLMLLQEAAVRAGGPGPVTVMGRPTCMALPAAMDQGLVMSFGCIGNRIYTEAGEDELYLVVPGRDIGPLTEEAVTIASANTKLAAYHRERKQALSQVL